MAGGLDPRRDHRIGGEHGAEIGRDPRAGAARHRQHLDRGGLRKALETALGKNEPAPIEVPVGELPDPWQFIDRPKVRGA